MSAPGLMQVIATGPTGTLYLDSEDTHNFYFNGTPSVGLALGFYLVSGVWAQSWLPNATTLVYNPFLAPFTPTLQNLPATPQLQPVS